MWTLLSSAETGGDYYFFEDLVPPGPGVPPHIHEREDEFIRVIDGELENFLNGETCKATSGATAYFPRSVVHVFTHIGRTPGRALFFVSPGANFEKFFEELRALPSHQPPVMAKVGEIFDRHAIRIISYPAA